MSDKQVREIEEFIRRRWPQDCNWLNGNCYWFAAILRARFPFLSIYYDAIDGHFVAGALDTYFDWTGKTSISQGTYLLDEIAKNDKQWYRRLLRDCIL